MLKNRIKQLEQEKEQLFQRIHEVADERNKLKEEIQQLKAKPKPKTKAKGKPVKAELLTGEEAALQQSLDIIREMLMKMTPEQRPKFILLIKSMAEITKGNLMNSLLAFGTSLKFGGL